MYDLLTKDEFIIEIRNLRSHLTPLANPRFIELLNETERRLLRADNTRQVAKKKGPQQGKRLTINQRMLKYL